MKKTYTHIAIGLLSFVPGIVFAQEQSIGGLVEYFTGFINDIIGLLSGIAFLVFLWGLVKFIYRADSEEGRRAGKSQMVWGIIGLFVLLSIWGIVSFFQLSIFNGTPDNVLDAGGGSSQQQFQ